MNLPLNKSGYFDDGSGISNYNQREKCSWHFKAMPTSLSVVGYLTVYEYWFHSFDLGTGDSITATDGISPATIFTSTSPPTLKKIYYTQAPNLTITFQSNDDGSVGAGFSFYASPQIQPACDGTVTINSLEGNFGPMMPYGPNLQCSWVIQPLDSNSQPIPRVELTFLLIDLASGDPVFIYDLENNFITQYVDFSDPYRDILQTTTGGFRIIWNTRVEFDPFEVYIGVGFIAAFNACTCDGRCGSVCGNLTCGSCDSGSCVNSVCVGSSSSVSSTVASSTYFVSYHLSWPAFPNSRIIRVKYRERFVKGNQWIVIGVDGSTTSIVLNDLKPNTQYEWVLASRNQDKTETSTVRQFFTTGV